MNKINYLPALFIIAFILFSCSSDKEEITPEIREPEVQTYNALIGDKGGVHLSGAYVSNDNEITEAGFEYSPDSTYTTKNRLIAEPSSDEELEYFLSSGIDKDVKYYYRAFVRTLNKSFYGDSNHFISDGSVVPEIDSLSQDFGHIADTLTIFGNYFRDPNKPTYVSFNSRNAELISMNDSIIEVTVPSNINQVINDISVRIENRADTYSSFSLFAPVIDNLDPIIAAIGDTITIEGNHFDIANSRNRVYFGGSQASVINSDRKLLKVIVPGTIQNISETIKLNAQLQDAVYPNNFQLAAPEITSISPLNATFRDEVTISGNNFDHELSRNKVYFGNIEATITYADKNTLKVQVPDGLESSSEKIKVEAQLQEDVYEENFQLLPPEISFVPQDVKAKQEITIQGKNFHPVTEKNHVTIEDIEVDLSSGNTEGLDTEIPLGPFPRRKAKVKLKLLDITVEYEVELNIIDNWVMISEELPFRFRRGPKNAVVVNNVAYILARQKGNYFDESVYLWRFDSTDFTWEKIDTNVPEHGTFASGILETNGSEIFYYTSNPSNDFWQYSIENNSWKKLPSFPGNRRDYPAHFSMGNDIYIGIGTDLLPYSPVSYEDFFKYNSSTNEWTQISDLGFDIWGGNRRTGMASFVIDDIAYLAGGASNTGDLDAWSYDPGSDSWIQIADFPFPSYESVGFQIGGIGYVTGGASIGGADPSAKSWSYSPDSDSWEESYSIKLGRRWHFSFVLNGKAYIGGGDNYSGGSAEDSFYEFIP